MNARARIKHAFATKRGHYKGAEQSRLTQDWITYPLTADDEIRTDLRRLRGRCRDLARNSPIARQYLGMLAVGVIGPTGFKHQAQVVNNDKKPNEKLNDTIEAAFKEWSYSVTLDGKLGLTRFQNQLLQSVARDGEVLVRKWRVPTSVNRFALALEAIDADMLDETYIIQRGDNRNEVRLGVEVDAYNRPVAYHLWDRPASLYMHSTPRNRVRVPAEEIIHLYDPERVNQTRGVPWFASVMYALRILDAYIEAEIVAARTGASKMGWFVRREGSYAGSIEAPKGALTTEANPGTFDFAPDGYELQEWSPQHPNAVFPEFVKSIMRQIATGLRVSYNALANDLQGVNYSSMRSGLLIERDHWRALQDWWCYGFLHNVYNEWLAQATLSGELRVDSRDFRKLAAVEFIGRGWQWVDPMKDTQAGDLALANGLTSRTRQLGEQGIDVETVFKELKREQELAEELGIELKAAKQEPPAGFGDDEDDPADEDKEKVKDEESKTKPSRNGHNRIAHVVG